MTLKDHLKALAESKLPIAACVLLIAAAWGVGRFSQPRIIERDTHHETETRLQDIKQSIDIMALRAMIQDVVSSTFRDTKRNVATDVTVKKPDGTVIERKTTDTTQESSGSQTAAHTETSEAVKATGTAEAKTSDVKDVKDEHFKLTEPMTAKARWSVGAFATYQPFFSPPGFNLLPQQRLTVGITVDHRIIGPLWLGGILTSTAAVGVDAKWVW